MLEHCLQVVGNRFYINHPAIRQHMGFYVYDEFKAAFELGLPLLEVKHARDQHSQFVYVKKNNGMWYSFIWTPFLREFWLCRNVNPGNRWERVIGFRGAAEETGEEGREPSPDRAVAAAEDSARS